MDGQSWIAINGDIDAVDDKERTATNFTGLPGKIGFGICIKIGGPATRHRERAAEVYRDPWKFKPR